jgi:hypothetical protein
MPATVKWKPAAGKSWREKLEEVHPNHGKVVPIPALWRKKFGAGTMLIPSPRDVNRIMRGVRRRRLITTSEIRRILASQAKADSACPLTTGIFIRVVAEAAEEDLRSGKRHVTPYWRTVKDDSSLNQKFPGGAAAQAEKLLREGFTIERGRRPRRFRVMGFERRLVRGSVETRKEAPLVGPASRRSTTGRRHVPQRV